MTKTDDEARGTQKKKEKFAKKIKIEPFSRFSDGGSVQRRTQESSDVIKISNSVNANAFARSGKSHFPFVFFRSRRHRRLQFSPATPRNPWNRLTAKRFSSFFLSFFFLLRSILSLSLFHPFQCNGKRPRKASCSFFR